MTVGASIGFDKNAAHPEPPTSLDVTLLGAGRVVSEYYLAAIAATGIARTLTIVDPDRAGLNVCAAMLSGAHIIQQDHHSYLRGLARREPTSSKQLTVVALPNQFHVEACEQLLRSGRDVLCEKPLSLSAEDCRRLGEIADVHTAKLSVAMVRRYLPSWMLAQQMVASGELGALVSIDAHDCAPFGWRPRSFGFFAPGAGGVLADMGVHYLDFLGQVAGPMTPVSYEDDWRGGSESSCRYSLTAKHVAISLELSRVDSGSTFVRLVGERGTLLLRKSSETQAWFTPCGRPEQRVQLERPFPDASWPANLSGAFCQLLADHAATPAQRVRPLATAFDAERVSGHIEWAYANRPMTRPAVSSGPAKAAATPQAFVTGGTGFIGAHLVDRLHTAGVAMRCSVRSPASVANLARYPVELCTPDLRDRGALRTAMDSVQTVFHLAYGKEGSDAAAITIDGTKAVVEAAIEAGVAAVVVLSTAYVFGFPDTTSPIDETSPNRPYGGVYGESKSVMEAWCLERAKTSGGTRIVVLNPSCVFGPGGGAYTTLPVTLAKQNGFAWFDDGRGVCNYIYVDNVIDAILSAAEIPAAHGHRFIITDGAATWKEFLGPLVAEVASEIPSYATAEFAKLSAASASFKLRELAMAIAGSPDVRRVARRSRAIRRISAMSLLDPLRIQSNTPARLPDWATQRPQRSPPIPPNWLPELYHTHRTTLSAAKAGRILDWRPRVTFEDAMLRTTDWLRRTGHLDRG